MSESPDAIRREERRACSAELRAIIDSTSYNRGDLDWSVDGHALSELVGRWERSEPECMEHPCTRHGVCHCSCNCGDETGDDCPDCADIPPSPTYKWWERSEPEHPHQELRVVDERPVDHR